MKLMFVDTNAWIALNYPKDRHHSKAAKLNRRFLKEGFRYITTNFVLDETYTGLLKKISHNRIVAFGENIKKSQVVRVIRIEPDHEDKGWLLFAKYSDKIFSFTDCTSFVVMRELHIKQVFTNDHNFEQVGFVKVLL